MSIIKLTLSRNSYHRLYSYICILQQQGQTDFAQFIVTIKTFGEVATWVPKICYHHCHKVANIFFPLKRSLSSLIKFTTFTLIMIPRSNQHSCKWMTRTKIIFERMWMLCTTNEQKRAERRVLTSRQRISQLCYWLSRRWSHAGCYLWTFSSGEIFSL